MINRFKNFAVTCRIILDLRFVLLLVGLAYFIGYFAISPTPGNNPLEHPEGWWGWFDQGKYLLSANAIFQGDFAASKHYYPPLYPALGAVFLNWSSGHPYFVSNLLLLLWFVYVFLRFCDQYVSRWVGIFLIFASTILPIAIFENYLMPWSSTLSAGLLATGLLGLVWVNEVRIDESIRITKSQVWFVGLCIGLVVPTRPADAVVGGIIGIGLIISYWITRREHSLQMPNLGWFALSTLAGIIIGPLIFLIFNFYVFGSPMEGYIQVQTSNGYYPADLLEKFVSLWIDGNTLYGVSDTALTKHYPWLFISLAALVWMFVQGDTALRVVAVAISVMFIIYMPYADLLPNGLWYYFNIHYFKWVFPYLALFAWLLTVQTVNAWQQRQGRFLPTLFLVGIPFLLLSLQFVVDVSPVSNHTNKNLSSIEIDLPDKPIDFVDIKGLTGGFSAVYFGGHHLFLDGKELQHIKDYRLLVMNWGVRVLFIRPVQGRLLVFKPDTRLLRSKGESLVSRIGTYHFGLGALEPFRNTPKQSFPISRDSSENLNNRD